jgi:hypothetical protein
MSEAPLKVGVYRKMVQVMKIVGQIEKDGLIKDKNGKDMYRYLSEEATTSAMQAAFIEVGLVVFPHELEETQFNSEGIKYEKPYSEPLCKVKIAYKIVDVDTGEWDIIRSVGYGSDGGGDKASNKAMTNAYKYMQRQAFAISTDSKDDADTTPTGDPTNFQPPDRNPNLKKVEPPKNTQPTSIQTKMATRNNSAVDLLEETKALWIQLAPEGDLTGFNAYYKTETSRNVPPERILELLKSRVAKSVDATTK